MLLSDIFVKILSAVFWGFQLPLMVSHGGSHFICCHASGSAVMYGILPDAVVTELTCATRADLISSTRDWKHEQKSELVDIK